MQAQIKLGRVLGIEIGLHYSWLIIALLIMLSLSGHFHSTNPEWSNAVVWFAAVATAFLFFAAIVIHELSHSIVVKSVSFARRVHHNTLLERVFRGLSSLMIAGEALDGSWFP
ncbi:MAG: hypothetical protein DMG13_16330 [Acidobacteria bacterium]|nr:MAG: hypothetical protein DMG13_16330 [Acidobacteriota bacterium]